VRLPTSAVTTLLRSLRDQVRRQYRAGRVVVAVDGVDGAGKTVFADGFAQVFAEDGAAVYRASIDGFHRPRVERYARGRTSPEGFYRDSYDYATFRRVLIDPFRTGHGTAFQLAAFDVRRDTPVSAQWVSAPRDAVLVVDGIFLHRPELRDLWDWSLWLEAPVATTFARMAQRDGTDPDPDAATNARYRLGQEIYLREADPRAAASVVVDNADVAHPVQITGEAR
jgi:uridine kinase